MPPVETSRITRRLSKFFSGTKRNPPETNLKTYELFIYGGKGKAVPVQAKIYLEGSRRLRLPGFSR
jgi:hypothetical protein